MLGEPGGGGGGGIGRGGRPYDVQSLPCLRCRLSSGFSDGFSKLRTSESDSAGSVGYSFGISTAAAMFSAEEDGDGFVGRGGWGGRSAGALGRGGGMSRGRTIFWLAGLGGEAAGEGKPSPDLTSGGGVAGAAGGFGAGTFFDVRRSTLGFTAWPTDVNTLLDPAELSDVEAGAAHAGRSSVAFVAARVGSGWKESEEITGEVTPPGFVMVTVHGATLAELNFCGVPLDELPPLFSPSPTHSHT